MNTNRTAALITVAVLLHVAQAGGFGQEPDRLAQQFLNPPASDRPAVYGFTFGQASDAVITRDLEEMKAKGLSACLIYDIGPRAGDAMRRGNKLVYDETENRIEKSREYDGPGAIADTLAPGSLAWSEEWLKTMRHAAKESGRLGLEFGICMGGAGCGMQEGVPVEFGEKTLVHSSKPMSGPAKLDEKLPLPQKVARNKDQTPRFYRDIAVLALPAQGEVQPAQVTDLSQRLRPDGNLRWTAPAGDWVILRFGYTVDASDRFIDHLSAEALDRKWGASMGRLLHDMTPEERKGLKFVECDSYEGGKQTWTPLFAAEFRKRRGYDLQPWLPVLAGRVVGSAGKSAEFQRDYRLTISDLYADNHYARHTALTRTNGLKFYSEAAGPHQQQTDLLKSISRCDVAMGEFWMPGVHRGVADANRFLLRDAAAAAHGYGMRDVFCEAFTGGNDPWRESPFRMKPCGDQAFCDGLTRPCIHGYNVSPWLNDDPGFVYWAGTYFNRHITWWEQAPAFLDYLARCSYLLRQGTFAADVAFYYVDGIGKPIPRKAALGASSQSPQGILEGRYDYDRINTEILLTRMSVTNGSIVLPDGLTYRVLVLAENEPLPVVVVRKLLAMVEAGATVLGARPPGPYGLMEDAAEFTELADELWGAGPPPAVGVRQVGKGRVVWGKPVLQLLREDGVPPDFECAGVSPKGVIDWIHRKTPEGDIYFVCSRWQPVEQVECSFRITGRIPELWDPVTGTAREAGAFRQKDERTIVPLRFDPCGSVFVLFRKPTIGAARAGKNWPEFTPLQEIAGPWTVGFDSKWFYPNPPGVTNATVVFDHLEDWTKRAEDAIKYHSGKATYRNSFEVPAAALHSPRSALFLDLGVVNELAEVRLNGKNLGVLWTKPFRVEVTGALKTGVNRLEIDVVNLWPNRLTGDTFLPKEKRVTRTNMAKYTQASQLLPSGLLGPVRLLAGSQPNE